MPKGTGLKSAALASVLAGALTVAAGVAHAREGKLLFLGNENIPPVVYLDQGTPAGVAVDIVQALGRHLPQPIDIRAMDWAEAQALVARGQADALIQINETEERKKLYDFSDALLESQFSIFVHGNRVLVSGISSLHGLRVGVEAAGLPREVLEKSPQVRLRILTDFLEGFRLLETGALDAVVVDYRVGSYVIAENGMYDIRISGEPVAFSHSALAVRKGNASLLAAINDGLRTIKADGTYQKILDKWKPTEAVFETRGQITRRTYYTTVAILLAMFLIAVLWTATLSRQLSRRKMTEQKLREQHFTLHSIMASANALIFSVDRQYRYTSFNEGHAAVMKELYGAEIELGRSVLEYMTVTEDRQIARWNIDRALAGVQHVEEAYSGDALRSRQYFQVSHSPIRSKDEILGVAVLAHDITERKKNEESLQRLNRELRAVSNCNQTLMRAQDEQTLLNDICRIVCNEAGYDMAWVGYVQGDDRRSVRPVAWAGREQLASADLAWPETKDDPDPAGAAIRNGKTICVQDLAADAQAEGWREGAVRQGYRSMIALPLMSADDCAFGVFSIYSTTAHAFTPGEMRLLEELTEDLAFGITVLRGRVELERVERERLDQVRLLECMNRVSRIIQGTTELEQMMSQVLDAMLSMFDCDRAVLMQSCDPAASSWSMRMQRCRPAYPAALVIPAEAEVAHALRIVLDAQGPVKFGPGTGHPLRNDVSERFGFKCFMAMALHPKIGWPWQFGIHQCSHARTWTAQEETLFAEIGRQVGEALSSLLLYNDLRAREREFRALAENSPDVIVRYDTACRRIYVNPAFVRVNRLTPEQVIGKDPIQLSTELAPMAATFTRRLKTVIETGVTTKIDLAWDRDGKHNLWYVRAVPEFDSNGQVASVLTIWSDITELKATEETIRKLHAELSATLQAIPDLLFDMDEKGTYLKIWANNEALLAAQRDVLLGRTVHEVLPHEAAETMMASLAEAETTGSSFGRVIQLELAGGTKWFELSVSKKAGTGAPGARFIVLSREITERKLAEDAVRKLNRDLEERVAERTADLQQVNAELEAFSYSVSHDLRAPLAAIDGFSHALTQKYQAQLDGEVQHYLERIRANAARMQDLIDDILNFSLTSRGEMRMAPVNMRELAREVFEELKGAAPQRKIILRLGELPPAKGDRAMIRQVLVNLLSNAIKYTAPRAEATIDVDGVAEGGRNTYRVTDNGVGFDMQYAHRLFGPFQRLHGVAEFEGTGIGLAIVKRIVVRHGGRVWAEGKVDQGASLYFTLPQA